MTRAPSPAASVGLLALRVALGALFVFAAYVKLRDPQLFAFSVAAFKILPDSLAALATFAIPWTEAVAGVALVLGVWARATSVLLMALLGAFIAGIVSVLARGMNVHCGCFGKFEIPCTGPVGLCHVARNVVLFGLAGTVAWAGPGIAALLPDRRPCPTPA